jgi:hypothetical protein
VKGSESANPIIFGRLGRNPDWPTITIYAHYDVVAASKSGISIHANIYLLYFRWMEVGSISTHRQIFYNLSF